MDRRFFIKTGGISLASFGLMAAAPEFLHQFASAADLSKGFGRKKVLVTIFQRGAVDGLNMIVPHSDSEYYNLRRTIAIQAPGKNEGAIDLDGFFGLHPTMNSLEPFWRSKQLAVVHSAGSPENTRSHFDAQDGVQDLLRVASRGDPRGLVDLFHQLGLRQRLGHRHLQWDVGPLGGRTIARIPCAAWRWPPDDAGC